MTPGAIFFLVLSWSLVLGLTAWSFARILRQPERRDGGGADEPGRR